MPRPCGFSLRNRGQHHEIHRFTGHPVIGAPVRESERRRLNVMEALIIAALVAVGALIFRLNDSVTRLQVAAENTNRQLIALQTQLADVPALSQRVSRNEVKIEALEEGQKELRSIRGLK